TGAGLMGVERDETCPPSRNGAGSKAGPRPRSATTGTGWPAAAHPAFPVARVHEPMEALRSARPLYGGRADPGIPVVDTLAPHRDSHGAGSVFTSWPSPVMRQSSMWALLPSSSVSTVPMTCLVSTFWPLATFTSRRLLYTLR